MRTFRTVRVEALLLGVLGSMCGCVLAEAFTCGTDAQCVSSTVAGVCQPTGYCSFPDDECASGQRYGEHAPAELKGQCVAEPSGTGDSTGDDTAARTSTAAETTGRSSSSGTSPSTSSTAESESTSADDESSTGALDDPDLVAWYRFEDTLDGWVEDSSENGLHGTCRSCPTPIRGVHGTAAHFDGVDQFVELPASALFDLEAMTVAGWVRVESWPVGARTIVGRAVGEEDLNSWEIIVWVSPNQSTYAVIAQLAELVDSVVSLPFGFPGPSLQWHHGAMTWNGNEARLYIDGGLVVQEEAPQVVYDDHLVLIGADSDHGQITNHLHGAIDDLRIYRRALSSEEVAELAALP